MGVEILDNGTRVLTAPGATFGTDALLLARFAQPRRNERALDLCSGCGIVSLVWHDAGHRGPCTALEIDPAASALCAAALADRVLWIQDGVIHRAGGKELIDEYFTSAHAAPREASYV